MNLENALNCVRRGWYVFPCEGKIPLHKGAFKDATLDEVKVREWWAATPNANPAIAPGKSGTTVLDIDRGLIDEASLRAFMDERGIPETFAVRTGKRPQYRVQLYFQGCGGESFNGWQDGEFKGDIRATWGHVMAPGSVHPESGEPYTILRDVPLAPVPDWVSSLKQQKRARVVTGNEPITEWRNDAMIRLLGKMRDAGFSDDMLRAYALQANAERFVPPLDEDELERLIENACKFPIGKPDPVAVIGKSKPDVKDWRDRYMTAEAFTNIEPPKFLIDDFLVEKSIAMLGGPVSQRKTILALNIAHALCTGEPLFGYFNVTGGHTRVIYACPEMGAASFSKRIKSIGLGPYIGETLFIQTMSEHPLKLDELSEELPGAVVIVDTITRFIEGDENKVEDMRKFAQKVFRLVNSGATVVLLHHSKKGSAGTLDDGLRGSSEIAAFVDSCWVTELEDVSKPYESLSKVRNVKQRDFESDPFRLRPAPGSYYLTMEGEPAPEAVVKDKKEAAARAALEEILKDSPKLGVNKLQAELKARGHGKGGKWVTKTRGEILGVGASLTPG